MRVMPSSLVAMAACLGGAAYGDSLTWDATGSSPNTPIDGSGNWDTLAANAVWSNVLSAPSGTAVDTAWNNSANNVAVFGNQIAGGRITIEAGNVTASGLVFDNTANNAQLGYTIASSGSSESLTLSGSAPTITTNADATIQAEITGTSGFTKNGNATLTLMNGSAGAGTVGNTYGGTATVAAGQLILNGSALSGDMVIQSGADVMTEQAGAFRTNANVTVNGTLEIGNSGQVGAVIAGLAGTGTVTLAQGSLPTLELNLTASQTFAGTLAGQGGVLIAGPTNGTLVETWTGTNTFSGPVSVEGSILSINSLQALGGLSSGRVTLAYGGMLRYTGAATGVGPILNLGAYGSGIDASGTGALMIGANVTGESGGHHEHAEADGKLDGGEYADGVSGGSEWRDDLESGEERGGDVDPFAAWKFVHGWHTDQRWNAGAFERGDLGNGKCRAQRGRRARGGFPIGLAGIGLWKDGDRGRWLADSE
jgi:hypothetical protein